jgi:anti-sigma regulatory factor (Ser/Thr protein kinase)
MRETAVTASDRDLLEISSTVSELERVFAFIDQYCQRMGVPDPVKYKLFLVAEELTVNSISHGYGGRPDGRIAMALRRPGDDVELRFEDEAPAFDILRDAPDPELDAPLADRRLGGLGVHLLKTLASTASYAHVSGRNVLHVTFAGA